MRRWLLLGTLIAGLAAVLWLAVSALAGGDPDSTRSNASASGSSSDTGSSRAKASTPVAARPAHPQAVEPTAGVAATASSSAAPATTPIGDPTAHAPSLAQVKREVKILDLCGGTTNSAFAQPLVPSSGPGFTPDPGTTQNVGVLPVVTARLDALGRALGVTIYGISGYRTPAHSVAVGGFADDPHTKGQAEDIGVNSLLRSSAAQITEGQFARFGLYRPFDPSGDPSNPEVNHIQLIPSGGPLSLAQATSSWSPDPRCR